MDSALKRTPLHAEHARLGARLVPFAGYEMPIQYVGITEEHHAVRRRVGIFDVSHMGEISITGPGALEAVDSLIVSDLTKTQDGQALYTCACNEEGTILDDLIVYRRSATDILVVCNASNREKMVPVFETRQSNSATVRDVSDDFALLAVQGPSALALLATAGAGDALSGLPSFHFTEAELGGVRCTLARTGYTGEDGAEIFVPPSLAAQLFRHLLDQGASLGVMPVGLGARDTLRLEARLSLYGNDIDETTNPLEAGLGRLVHLNKPEFVGKAALTRVSERGLTRRLVGFEMTGRGIARHGYPLGDASGATFGICTSGGPSPTLGKNIGLGYVPLAAAAVGTEISVDCRGKRVSAVVVRTPFYKRPAKKD
ncbi:MAG TPA: glycine cleavage system aminomethyltransferase GcvT [Polyangiaceae bacterium]|nr:glycine cleavage system aminomethyltransferase GcvT [Polyangiaceae bacterium]